MQRSPWSVWQTHLVYACAMRAVFFGTPAIAVPALQALARERAVPFATVASAIWEAWDDAQRPSDGAAFLAPEASTSTLFWPHIPSELLEVLLCDARATEIPYQTFDVDHWQAFLTALGTAPARAEDARAFALAPDPVLEEAMRRGVESRALFASVWQRAPERAESELVRALNTPEDDDLPRLSLLLEAAPPAQLSRVFEAFSRPDMANLGREKLAAVRRFLHHYIRARKTGYVEAYARLSELERQLALAR